MAPKPSIPLPAEVAIFLRHYLPHPRPVDDNRPYVTLTYATSLDSHLSLAPGVQTALSGPKSKAMTHYLRSQHQAILVGVSTAIADDPGLNCRIEGDPEQPTPIILDPMFRWQFTRDARVLQTARNGEGRGPVVFVAAGANREEDPRIQWIEEAGGAVIALDGLVGGLWEWSRLLEKILELGFESLMVEGGAGVINSLLAGDAKELVDAVIVTIAPVYLGAGGVNVSPPSNDKTAPVVKFREVKWGVFDADAVMAARLEKC